jgi:oligopeptide/dipeptide ABC transporter ATP-binding protein
MPENHNVLSVKDLRLHFRATRGVVQAVDGVDFDLPRNRATVVIGESGCGKSSLAKAILRLLPRNVDTYSGQVFLEDLDTMALNDDEYRETIRWKRISMVPQAAMNALNPVITVGNQVAEPAMLHLGLDRKAAFELVLQSFAHVGVPADFANRYAFELSGGMRQRAILAMALIAQPDVIILDEPTSALDVLTQANIMNLLKRVKKELQTSFILITHDIATSSELADDVAVMYAGQIVEVGDAAAFFGEPLHPYSYKLMASVPRLRTNVEPEYITGKPPSLLDPPSGCRFAERCHRRFDKCSQEPPAFRVGTRLAKCWLHE